MDDLIFNYFFRIMCIITRQSENLPVFDTPTKEHTSFKCFAAKWWKEVDIRNYWTFWGRFWRMSAMPRESKCQNLCQPWPTKSTFVIEIELTRIFQVQTTFYSIFSKILLFFYIFFSKKENKKVYNHCYISNVMPNVMCLKKERINNTNS